MWIFYNPVTSCYASTQQKYVQMCSKIHTRIFMAEFLLMTKNQEEKPQMFISSEKDKTRWHF